MTANIFNVCLNIILVGATAIVSLGILYVIIRIIKDIISDFKDGK